jgi:hypothetical protein
MRMLLPLLVLLLTASAAWANMTFNGRRLSPDEERVYYAFTCSICMVIFFAPVLILMIGRLVYRRLRHSRTNLPKSERNLPPQEGE